MLASIPNSRRPLVSGRPVRKSTVQPFTRIRHEEDICVRTKSLCVPRPRSFILSAHEHSLDGFSGPAR